MASEPKKRVSGKAMAGIAAAMVALYGYQKAWITDEARFKLYVKGRQEGITFATTLRHVRRRLAKKGTTVWVSASERQSREAVEYAKLHLAALNEAFDYEEIDFPGVEAKALQLTFRHNGARLIAMPANPDTMRGFSGDVVLDEFAFHRDALKIWRAALAIASRGYQVEVISTPNGQRGKYWDIARAAEVPPLGFDAGAPRRWTKGVWSIHWTDIYAAVKDGCPVNIEELRAAAGDEDTWVQEYCCGFLADAENYIPMELIIAAESQDASLEVPAAFVPRGEMYLGWDVGRKKDRTVVWLLERLGDVLWTRAVIPLIRVPYREQFELIDSLMPGVNRACGDATGIGAQIGEDLVRKHGAKVEAVEFNIANKEMMATSTKRHFEERTVRIPSSNQIRFACNAVKRYTSPTGHFRFDAERTEQGHADEFWALALACAAAHRNVSPAMGEVDIIQERGRDRGLMSRAAARGSEDGAPGTTERELLIGRGERRDLWA